MKERMKTGMRGGNTNGSIGKKDGKCRRKEAMDKE
jgi:hypothetical protein